MTQKLTRRGLVDVAVMGDRQEVLIPLVSAWSLHADRLRRAQARATTSANG